MNKSIEFPRYIDDPPTLLIWRLDDLMPMVLSLVIGILTGQLLLFLLAGWAMSHGYRKFRDRAPDGYAIHLLYWWGLIPMGSRTVGNPYDRRHLP
jgi:conjugal transfer pilus assembly protein TraL